MLTRDDFAAWIKPCPENGKSHDCSHEYLMWMPVALLDSVLERQGGSVEHAERAYEDAMRARAASTQ